jgi:hypothetical protein
VLPTESKDLRLLFVSAPGHNATRSSLNLDTAWRAHPISHNVVMSLLQKDDLIFSVNLDLHRFPFKKSFCASRQAAQRPPPTPI